MEVLASGFYPLIQLCTINIPTTLDELRHFLMDISLLKRIHVAYKEHCSKLDSSQILKVQQFKKRSITSDELSDVLNSLSPKENTPVINASTYFTPVESEKINK